MCLGKKKKLTNQKDSVCTYPTTVKKSNFGTHAPCQKFSATGFAADANFILFRLFGLASLYQLTAYFPDGERKWICPLQRAMQLDASSWFKDEKAGIWQHSKGAE